MREVLQFISEGGSVVRYHTRPGIKPDTDAHHSHGVAMLCELLSGGGTKPQTGANASANLLMAALSHDLAEQKPGDMSAPAKRLLRIGTYLHEVEQATLSEFGLDYEQFLTEREKLILSLADCFDGMMYCCRELTLGNRNVLLIWRRYCEYAESITSADSNNITYVDIALRAANMYEAIIEIYHEIRGENGPSFDIFAGS